VATRDLNDILPGVSWGDRVICTESFTGLFTPGSEYTVTKEYRGSRLGLTNDRGFFIGSFMSFFEAAKDQDIPPHDRTKTASDGGSTDYYAFPPHATELRHLISAKDMSFSRGNLFKACYRLGEKDGVDPLYDLNKMKFFIEDLIEMHERGEHI